ncbi:similar to Saccharomyces cerevisiae YDR067C OCA6 Cytoplasmic protein required for replication of Brome mosaic virus in Saccharomyces cerevisiae [Maudiozyma barnettii]|uniref:Similar to Saccharomyces cerevisiae YDR067C OCA6 Cytoplasmic protein required for replication of Brome mosaic virus in Saccharomyces cerevisiae n=1 Tax=Maudiozyma barnettii TaxID=61262 RepID=A0A8H2VJI6_9SACH|nr:protein-tyrosine-phosphatase [Kazachstania barnettii]CAB4256587.1 similar to Saccharomyces cerevisiae YDR067C OCA6 Cytoplasmic protein required for replication of Brome mosaic virus in Saccharomyces cerevisiae [Kazachstania barnettii]CAD1785190.1 similar to Saccharomyces cerevisiae YDR067C OCA6 Cytoplasmic protein required for replication of Brome mosaic virus in Saccharomyces cerevisiae [Kazachstania barnettii]
MSLVTPLHFNTVQLNLYRGSSPREINIPFLKRLRLKYILSLTPEPLDETMTAFCKENDIKMKHIKCNDKPPKDKTKKVKRKKKTVPIEYDTVIECVAFLVDRRNYPIYMHCHNGELITSLVVACLRKFSYWSTVSILNEFLIYNSSINVHERSFIEHFNLEVDIQGLKPKDKVPWVSGQFITKTSKSKNKQKDITKAEVITTVSNNIPNALPKLKFHSI